MMLSLAGDLIVAALLVATIAYAAVLNGRLAILRGDRAKLDELVKALTGAAAQADAGIAALKFAAEDAGRRLEKKVEEGRSLSDDLTYMLERGGLIADRLEGTIRARRDDGKPDTAPERKRDARPDAPAPRPTEPARVPRAAATDEGAASRPVTASRAERDLLRALAGR